MTKEDVFKIMLLIEGEQPGFIPKDEAIKQAKVNNWFDELRGYEKNDILKVVKQMLKQNVYKPTLANLFEVLIPKAEDQNLGIEFADSLMNLQRRFGTDNMGVAVYDKWGKVGFDIFNENKADFRVLLEKDTPNFKTRLRDHYNSVNGREIANKKQAALPGGLKTITDENTGFKKIGS